MALAFVVGPFVVAKRAFDGDLLAFPDIAFHPRGYCAPSDEIEPMRFVHPFVVGVFASFRHGKAETGFFFVVAQFFTSGSTPGRPISMTEFLIVLMMVCVFVISN